MDTINTNLTAPLEPNERLKQLTEFSDQFKVEAHVSPIRYYRSGIQILQQANVYLQEGSLENAYVLYLKYLTLFLEKIRKHPDFNKVPPHLKSQNMAKLKEVAPVAEILKAKLLKIYTDDYNRYLAELKQKEEQQRRDKEKKDGKRVAPPQVPPNAPQQTLVAVMPNSIDAINYPDYNLPADKPLPSAPPATPSAQGPIEEPEPIVPTFDRSKKPDIQQYSYNSGVLRTVIVPATVMKQFLHLAQGNTMNNVETCAVLAGKLAKNELIITHMIFPKQKGTSDSCITMNEEELFDFQDQFGLITIGWIHTHPTQTAFLSSVDLHTHCSYQLLMPEAIAIVCAPKYNEIGYFILTPNYGLQFIANCPKSGFHPHPTEPPLFKTADHIRIENTADLDILDLR